MGLFSNPLSYAGYPPGVTGTPTTQNASIRAATAAEAAAGTLEDVYISPATAQSSVALDFASPPVLGYGSTTPRPVASTTLTSTLNTSLATAATATAVAIGNAANSGALTVQIANGANAANATVSVLSGNATAGTQTFNLLGGTRAGVANIGTGAAVHAVNICGSTATLGFFGQTAAVKQSQGALTNNVTAGGVTGTIANYTDLTVYANDAAAIRNDIYQLALALSGVITGLRNYGLLV